MLISAPDKSVDQILENPRDTLRETLRAAMDDDRPELLLQWASSEQAWGMLPWQRLHEAWALSSNKGMLTWDLLHQCIELAQDNVPEDDYDTTTKLSTLNAFTAGTRQPKPLWIEAINEQEAFAFIEQVVAWRLMAKKVGIHSKQTLETSILMQLCIGCKQGRIWQDHPGLYNYPMDPSQVMQYAEDARCTDSRIYNAVWNYQQEETTRAGWKRQILAKNQLHNLKQLSNTPFMACEYVLEQHAAHNCVESYAAIIRYSLLSDIKEVDELDAWMLTQLAQLAGSWEKTGCPTPEDKQIQAWWYSLQLGLDDLGLMQMLSPNPPESSMALTLPADSFTPY